MNRRRPIFRLEGGHRGCRSRSIPPEPVGAARLRTRLVTGTLLCLLVALGGCGSPTWAGGDDLAAPAGWGGDRTERAPFGWLKLESTNLVLDLRQVGVDPEIRSASSAFTESVLRELVEASFRVHVSRGFLESEIMFLESVPHLPGSVEAGLLECLRDSLRAGRLDWEAFAGVWRRAGASAGAASVWQPWSLGMRGGLDVSRVVLAAAEAAAYPTLAVKTRWMKQGGYQRTGTIVLLMPERLTVKNLSADLRLTDGRGTRVLERDYPAPPFQGSYTSWAETPSEEQVRRILGDLRRGLKVDRVTLLKPLRLDLPSLAGTSWRITEEGRVRVFCFDAGGRLRMPSDGTLRYGDEWEQEGDVVRIGLNRRYAEYEGRLDASDRMAGVRRSELGASEWSAQRIPADGVGGLMPGEGEARSREGRVRLWE